MISVEVLEFCEDNAISIEKFLHDNFNLESYIPKKNSKNRRWRIKHNEIAGWYNVIPVSIMFAHRYKHLVLTGKLVIVRDDYGKYTAYINPRIIQESQQLGELQTMLQQIEEEPESFDNVLKMVETKRQLVEKINDLEENIRIIKHFNGEESLEYTMGIIKLLSETEGVSRRRERLEKKDSM